MVTVQRGGYGVVPRFTDIASLLNIDLVDTSDYYNGVVQGGSESIVLPNSFPQLALKFRALDKSKTTQFLRAAYWAAHMNAVWGMSRSAAYVAAVSAIEALMPAGLQSDTVCESCGTPQRPGITQRFAEFVDEMVRDAVPRKQRLQFYSRRSRMVHGQRISRMDEIDFDDNDPTRFGEDGEHRWLASLTRIVLNNWLASQ